MNWSKGRKQKLKSGVEEDVLYNRKLHCYLINRPKNVKKAKKAMNKRYRKWVADDDAQA